MEQHLHVTNVPSPPRKACRQVFQDTPRHAVKVLSQGHSGEKIAIIRIIYLGAIVLS